MATPLVVGEGMNDVSEKRGYKDEIKATKQ